MTKEEWIEEFSYNLRALIHESGLSQREIAKRSGTNPSNISRYVNGTQIPTPQTIVNLAFALECDTDDLINFDETIED